MLRVTLKMIPHGDEQNSRTLATLEIVNDGEGDHRLASYWYRIERDDGYVSVGRVKDHRRDDGALSLMRRVLDTELGGHEEEVPTASMCLDDRWGTDCPAYDPPVHVCSQDSGHAGAHHCACGKEW